jgi:hypothetical protein
MAQKRTDLLRGTLDLLVLKAISLEPLHGVAISRRGQPKSPKGRFRLVLVRFFPHYTITPHRGKGLGGSRVALV